MDMGYDPNHEAIVSDNDVNTENPEVESNEVDILEREGVAIGELGNVTEVLIRVELDLACASEKLLNLSGFMMHVATKESDFDAFISKEEQASADKALEFTFLSGFLDSEVGEFGKLVAMLQMEITGAQELLSSYTYLGETFAVMEEKLRDSEQSLKQLQDQASEIRVQSLKLQRTFSYCDEEEKGNSSEGVGHFEDDIFSSKNLQIKMQSVEQQRHILRVLEKTLAREMDLEKKLTDSKQIEEDLKLRLLASEQEVYCIEDEGADVWGKWLQADNASGVMTDVSKELLGRLHLLQFNLNGSVQREAELRSKLDGLLKEKNSKAEGRIENAEAKCKLLTETNTELNEELGLLKRQLIESEMRLQHAVASAEASQEKQNMLDFTVSDMECVMEDLKQKVSKAESRADSVEDKCIIVSEINAELNEELSFLKGKLKRLEAALHQAEEAKISTATDIALRSKIITNLIVQLAFERERLHKQMSSLKVENRNLILKFQRDNCPSVVMHDDDRGNGKDSMLCQHDFATDTRETGEEASVLSDSNKLDRTPNTEVGPADTVRRVDAGVLNFKHLVMAIVIVLISASAYFFTQQVDPFDDAAGIPYH